MKKLIDNLKSLFTKNSPQIEFYRITFKISDAIITYRARKQEGWYIVIIPFDECPQSIQDHALDISEEESEFIYPPLFTQFSIPLEQALSAVRME